MSEAYTEQDLREARSCDCHVCDCDIETGGCCSEERPCVNCRTIAAEFARIRSEARAGMREACAKACVAAENSDCEECNSGCHDADAAAIRELPDLAADEAIERIRDEAHEVALPLAAEQIIGALTAGGEFAEGSPLAKVMQAIERIKREARLEARIDEWRDAVVYFLSADLHGNDIEKIKEYVKSHSADLNHQLAALRGKETA